MEVLRKLHPALLVPSLGECRDDDSELGSGDCLGRGHVRDRTALGREHEVDVPRAELHARGTREVHVVCRDGVLERVKACDERGPELFVETFRPSGAQRVAECG